MQLIPKKWNTLIYKKIIELTVLQNSKKGFQIASHYTVNMPLHGRNLFDEEKTSMCCIKYQENRLYSIRGWTHITYRKICIAYIILTIALDEHKNLKWKLLGNCIQLISSSQTRLEIWEYKRNKVDQDHDQMQAEACLMYITNDLLEVTTL